MFHRTTLKNGLRLISVPREESLSVNLLVLVGVGTNFETKEINGLSHFLEHMCFKGTTKRPHAMDISSELDALGAEYNAFTGREYTGYYVSCLPERLDEALDILSDLYLHPLLDEAEIEKEKGVIGEEINRAFDNPARRVQDLFTELVFGDTPLGWSTLGPAEGLKKLGRTDFLACREKYYQAGNTVVVAAGQFDRQTIGAKIEQCFTGITVGQRDIVPAKSPRPVGPGLRVEYRKSEQSNLVLGFQTFGEDHPSYETAEVLAGILGGTMSSRLWQRIREEMGAAYSISAFQTAYIGYGFLAVAGGVQSAKLPEVIKVILSETDKLKTELAGEKELARVKDSLIGTTFLNLETPFDLATYYGLEEVRHRPATEPEDWATKIRAVTAEEVQKLAQKIFVVDGLNLAVLGPHQDVKAIQALIDNAK